MALTFKTFSRVNLARVKRWHKGFPGGDGWTGADWSNAMVGEAGEVANAVKKLRRDEDGLTGNGELTRAELLADLADELGDVVAYLDLLAQYYGIDLAEAVANKFNKVSKKNGFPEKVTNQDVEIFLRGDREYPRPGMGGQW